MKNHAIAILAALLLFAPACRRSTPAAAAAQASSSPAVSSSLAFGAPCVGDADCASKVCSIGNNGAFCSIKCTSQTEAVDCPKPLTAGRCNRRGFCKRP